MYVNSTKIVTTFLSVEIDRKLFDCEWEQPHSPCLHNIFIQAIGEGGGFNPAALGYYGCNVVINTGISWPVIWL